MYAPPSVDGTASPLLHVGDPAVKDCDGVVVDCACTAAITQFNAAMRHSEDTVISAGG